jgi:hypothetical protein
MTSAFLSKEYFKDPYVIYRDFHANSPIFWHPDIKAWIISSYSEVEKGAYRGNKKFSKALITANTVCHVISLDVTKTPASLLVTFKKELEKVLMELSKLLKWN